MSSTPSDDEHNTTIPESPPVSPINSQSNEGRSNDQPSNTQESVIIPPGGTVSCTTSDDAKTKIPTKPLTRLSQVTYHFVTNLIRTVERNYAHLASLEARLSQFQAVIAGKQNFPDTLRVKRYLPSLAGDFNFSVVAQVEINNIDSSNDRRVIIRLRDDLITNIIPNCQAECKQAEVKARKRIQAECPPKEIVLTKQILEREIIKKSEARGRQHEIRMATKKRRAEFQAGPRRQYPPPLMGSQFSGQHRRDSRQ